MFINDSLHDRDIFHRTDSTAVRLYFVFYNRWVRAFSALILFMLMLLALFENPAVIPTPHGVCIHLYCMYDISHTVTGDTNFGNSLLCNNIG
jgi:hypothetical protein